MREIKFRGKRLDNGEWVYGDYCDCRKLDNTVQIRCWVAKPENYYASYDVDPSTVGQYTGLKGKNGKEIYEGDIVKSHYANAIRSSFAEHVVFHNGKFCAEGNIGTTGKSWASLADGIKHISQDKSVYMDCCEVIGDIHDNPELLEEE